MSIQYFSFRITAVQPECVNISKLSLVNPGAYCWKVASLKTSHFIIILIAIGGCLCLHLYIQNIYVDVHVHPSPYLNCSVMFVMWLPCLEYQSPAI